MLEIFDAEVVEQVTISIQRKVGTDRTANDAVEKHTEGLSARFSGGFLTHPKMEIPCTAVLGVMGSLMHITYFSPFGRMPARLAFVAAD